MDEQSKPDKNANSGFILTILPILVIIIGVYQIKTTEDAWAPIAYSFMMLFASVIVSLPSFIFGIKALNGGTNKKEKAVISIFIPVVVILVSLFSIGGID